MSVQAEKSESPNAKSAYAVFGRRLVRRSGLILQIGVQRRL